jgi:hypothetical protein
MEDYDRGFNTWREALEFALFAVEITQQRHRVRLAKNGLEWLVDSVPA